MHFSTRRRFDVPQRFIPRVTVLCFFLISVGYKLAWTAISSLLSYYSSNYGPGILLKLNIAYFFPSIPILVLQTIFNDRMDRRFGLPMAALIRYIIGLGGLAYITYIFPSLTSGSESRLLGFTALVGVCYGVAFGTSYQMASKFPPASTVALTTGFVSSGPVIFALDVFYKDSGAFYSTAALAVFFRWVGTLTLFSLTAAAFLVTSNRKFLITASRKTAGQMSITGILPFYAKGAAATATAAAAGRLSRASSALSPSNSLSGAGSMGLTTPTSSAFEHLNASSLTSLKARPSASSPPASFDMRSGSGSGPGSAAVNVSSSCFLAPDSSPSTPSGSGHLFGLPSTSTASAQIPLRSLARRISPAALAIFLSVGTSMAVFPFFTFVHSTGVFGEKLSQVLFYLRLGGDVVGRLLPRRLQTTSVPVLMMWALLKLLMTSLLLLAIFRPRICGGDVGLGVLVVAFWVLSGFLNTCAYLTAPTLVPPTQKARASGIMTVAFQTSCLIALLAASAIQASLPWGATRSGAAPL